VNYLSAQFNHKCISIQIHGETIITTLTKKKEKIITLDIVHDARHK
jgi:hypothetical protein